jgi:hypothetical protein
MIVEGKDDDGNVFLASGATFEEARDKIIASYARKTGTEFHGMVAGDTAQFRSTHESFAELPPENGCECVCWPVDEEGKLVCQCTCPDPSRCSCKSGHKFSERGGNMRSVTKRRRFQENNGGPPDLEGGMTNWYAKIMDKIKEADVSTLAKVAAALGIEAPDEFLDDPATGIDERAVDNLPVKFSEHRPTPLPDDRTPEPDWFHKRPAHWDK